MLELTNEKLKVILGRNLPFFIYSKTQLDKTISELQTQFKSLLQNPFDMSFSVKSQPNYRIVRLMKEAGFSVDVSSHAELKYVLEIGFQPDKIALGGCGLTDRAIKLALERKILAIHCDNVETLLLVQEFKERTGQEFPKVTVRFHPEFLFKTKIGFYLSELETLQCKPLDGLHVYLGRESFTTELFMKTLEQCSGLMAHKHLFKQGSELFLGPGLPATFDKLFSTASKKIKFDFKLHLEVGRSLTSSAGHYAAQVLSVKKNESGQISLIIDGGLQHLGSPWVTLKAGPTTDTPLFFTSNGEPKKVADSVTAAIFGSLCLWQDCLHPRLSVPQDIKRGDWIFVPNKGSYGLTAGVPTFIGENLPNEYIIENGSISDVTHNNFKLKTKK